VVILSAETPRCRYGTERCVLALAWDGWMPPIDLSALCFVWKWERRFNEEDGDFSRRARRIIIIIIILLFVYFLFIYLFLIFHRCCRP